MRLSEFCGSHAAYRRCKWTARCHRHQGSGRDAERGAQHAADHDAEAPRPALARQRQRLGETTGLVEFDVDGVEIAQAVEIGAGMTAFVGAERQARGDASKPLLLAMADGLLDHLDAQRGQGGRLSSDVEIVPALVRVDDEARLRSARAHGGDPVAVARAGKLALEQAEAARRGGAGVRLHPRGIVEADGEGGGERCGRGEARQAPDRLAGALRLQVPERAVERVARRAARHRLQQRLPVERPGIGADRRRAAFGRLALIIDRRAFAPAEMVAVAHGADDHVHEGLGAPADDEGARDRPAFDGRRKDAGHRRFLRNDERKDGLGLCGKTKPPHSPPRPAIRVPRLPLGRDGDVRPLGGLCVGRLGQRRGERVAQVVDDRVGREPWRRTAAWRRSRLTARRRT